MISPNTIFNKAREITKEDARKNKYTMNAYRLGLDNYKILTLNTILKRGWNEEDLPEHIMKFINEKGEVLLIANIVLNDVQQLQIRALDEKEFRVLGSQTSIPYGLGKLDKNFKYGDWLILVEGTSDRDSMAEIYQNTLAVLTSGLSLTQLNLIKYLTNQVILMYDFDKAGMAGMNKDRKRLKELNFEVERFYYPDSNEFTDPGDLWKFEYEGESFLKEEYNYYIKNWLSNITGGEL